MISRPVITRLLIAKYLKLYYRKTPAIFTPTFHSRVITVRVDLCYAHDVIPIKFASLIRGPAIKEHQYAAGASVWAAATDTPRMRLPNQLAPKSSK